MEIQEILQELKYHEDGKFPRKALQEAIAQQEAIAPELLAVLQHCIDRFEDVYEDYGYMLHIYAMFLLAQFRETRAYPLIAEFFSIPDERIKEFNDSIVTEYLPRILASVSGGDMTLICRLIENPALNGFIRWAGLSSLVTLMVSGDLSRKELIAYFKSLFQEKFERKYSTIWDGLVSDCLRVYPEELYDDIRQAYDDNLVETFFFRFEDVDQVMEKGKEAALIDVRNDRHYSLISDTIVEMENWYCFQTPKQTQADDKKLDKLLDKQIKKAAKAMAARNEPSSQPVRRVVPKVGRNDPCPCGSGKKYKKCCLNKSTPAV